MILHCPECGAENPAGTQYCSLCLTSLGFESPEFPTVEAHEEGLAPGVDKSRELTSGAGVPSDYRSPADWSGASPRRDEENVRASRAAAFSWDRGTLLCVYSSVVAGAATLGLEFILALVVLNAIVSGSVDVNYTWIFITLLVPVFISAVFVGYRAGRYGWALGMITVAIWAIVTKPMFNLFFLWIMDASHVESPFVWARITLDLGVALPFGALLGWLGERRATARTTIRT